MQANDASLEIVMKRFQEFAVASVSNERPELLRRGETVIVELVLRVAVC